MAVDAQKQALLTTTVPVNKNAPYNHNGGGSMSEPNKPAKYSDKSEKEMVTDAAAQQNKENQDRRNRVMTRIRFEHLTNKVELKLDPMRTALLGAGIEDWNTTDELSELIELVRKEIYPPPATVAASNAPATPQVASNPPFGGKEQSFVAASTTGQQPVTGKPAENVPKTLEKVPTLLASRVSDAVWTALNSDERSELELYFLITAMWAESGYMRRRISVQEAGRKVSMDASRPLAIEVYNAYV